MHFSPVFLTSPILAVISISWDLYRRRKSKYYLGHTHIVNQETFAQLLARLKTFVEQVTRFLPRHLPFVFLKKWGLKVFKRRPRSTGIVPEILPAFQPLVAVGRDWSAYWSAHSNQTQGALVVVPLLGFELLGSDGSWSRCKRDLGFVWSANQNDEEQYRKTQMTTCWWNPQSSHSILEYCSMLR